MAGIATTNIDKPGAIHVEGGINRALISDLQLLKPEVYGKYTEKYGKEAFDNFFMWLSVFGGMEEVKNREFSWYENRGKLMQAITNSAAVVAPAAGATVTVTLPAADHYNSGTQSAPIAGETVRVASSNIEGVILTKDDSVDNAHVLTIRPKKSTQAFVSAGSANLLQDEVILLAGFTDVGEASTEGASRTHLDEKFSNYITEIRHDWSATDLAEMTEIWYNGGASGSAPASQAGTSYFTYKGLIKANQEFLNNLDMKLMRGDLQNNTGLSGSTGSQGFIPKIVADGETVTYTAGTLDLAKIHEITRVMDVNGCAKENMWLMDIFQSQSFNDSLFAEYAAGAWVWGTSDRSQEAAIAYGVRSILIDGYLFKAKKYTGFNTEVVYGKTPTNDYFRNFGIIIPQGETRDARDASKSYKNLQVMYQRPPKGGSTGNGIRVWQHGGGSVNATDGTMKDKVSQITYRGTRVTKANQFIVVQQA
jgi:hypothetical protein